ncbi:MAG TPA: alpha-glucuronidase, partial [Candidatus Limnocylindria bacterium]|nr:alpha-glucuronidase [Candidatus Limnocylindria bacterium]
MNAPAGEFAWLPYLAQEAPGGAAPAEAARRELAAGLSALGIRKAARVEADGAGEGFRIREDSEAYIITGGEPGILYGAYRLLTSLYLGRPVDADESPFYPLRILNHWDNMDGSVERGYAGKSLFFRDGKVSFDAERIRRYGRLLASVGINAVCPNNVNVVPPADRLVTGEGLDGISRLADTLRPFGIRLLLAVDFSLPTRSGLSTADPLDEGVQAFWAHTAEGVYRRIPDLAGFVVKADSESRPGPFTYGRTQADGANMLARALLSHGGKLFWRCFVYNCAQDWRDQETDRPRAAYDHFAPMDGQFLPNVVLQVKNGPLDFQVREPVSPMLLGMPGTQKALEVQLAQEYTGQQVDLFYLAPQWKDVLKVLPREKVCCAVGVSNLGNDANWTGHDLAQANLYAFGKMCWDGAIDPAQTALEWARLTFPDAAAEVGGLLLRSPDVYEKYASPLGVGFMVNPSTHYGPSPMGYEFSRWGTFHRADREALGV